MSGAEVPSIYFPVIFVVDTFQFEQTMARGTDENVA